MMTYILETKDLRYSYTDGHEALKGIDLSIEDQSKVALVGPNGAGKSTLMLMFNAILRPTSGQVLFRGEPYKYDSKSLRDIRKHVGMVLQNADDQLFAPTVYQDVGFGPINLGYDKDKVDRYTDYALRYVGLDGYQKRPPHHLSGGEKKRVAIAGVLAMEPDVMVLDEPTSNLDPASAEEIMEMLDELNFYKKTIVISTHDVDLAYRWSDHVILMERGKVLQKGDPRHVFQDGETLRKTRMKLPMVMEFYRELINRALLTERSKPPRSILDVIDLLDHENAKTRRIGKIYVCDLQNVDLQVIKDLLSHGSVDYIGAMGTKAKLITKEEELDLDFSYGVIDKCILKAITGKNSLILTTGGMVDHAIRRIGEYGENGIKIETIKIQRSTRYQTTTKGSLDMLSEDHKDNPKVVP